LKSPQPVMSVHGNLLSDKASVDWILCKSFHWIFIRWIEYNIRAPRMSPNEIPIDSRKSCG